MGLMFPLPIEKLLDVIHLIFRLNLLEIGLFPFPTKSAYLLTPLFHSYCRASLVPCKPLAVYMEASNTCIYVAISLFRVDGSPELPPTATAERI